jgi:Arc/MetJ-type ribon-helix-helix transcriptional regulator
MATVAGKRKAVINAERDQLSEAEELVRAGRYRTLSEFVREAMAEKLERLRAERRAEQVRRYADEVRDEDADLVAWQAFAPARAARKGRRAKR